MTELEQKTETYKGRDINYYEMRLNEIKRIYIQEGREILDQNINIIKDLVNEYKERFQKTDQYQTILVDSIETFIL